MNKKIARGRRNVLVLGIHASAHDTGVCLIENGKILAALLEERLTNCKHYGGFPLLSLRKIFKVCGRHPQDVTIIAFSGILLSYSLNHCKSTLVFPHSPIPYLCYPPFRYLMSKKIFRRFTGYIRILTGRARIDALALKKVLNNLGLLDKEMFFVEHHLAHASSAYRTCPWNGDVLVLTADGMGDGVSSSVNVGSNGNIRRIAYTGMEGSPGFFYLDLTRALGLRPMNDEYKVMGLAGYGDPNFEDPTKTPPGYYKAVQDALKISDNHPLKFSCTLYNHHAHDRERTKFYQRIWHRRFDHIAAAAQKRLEDVMCKWVKSCIKETGLSNIAAAGGVFLNVKMNKVLLSLPEVENLYVFPAASDGGLCVGVALEAYSCFCEQEGIKKEHHPIEMPYFGTEYSNEEIEVSLKKNSLFEKAEFCKDIDSFVGELLAKGKIVGRFVGRMEFGPRALGNRSVLCDARDVNSIKRINDQIKFRDWWMPFAPTILEEAQGDYLVEPYFSPYMTMAFDSTPQAKKDIIAAMHQGDFTVRPQVLRKEWNLRYYKVVDEFRTITGTSGILNTSFNLHGYPIVESPDTALYSFLNSKLDWIAMGDFILKRDS